MSKRIWLSMLLVALTALHVGPARAIHTAYDPTFGNARTGESNFDLGDANGKESWALRVFERPTDAGYFILAKHGRGNGTWDAVVLAIDKQGRNEKKYLIPTPMFRLDDATYDQGNGKFYFVGGAKRAGHADSDFAVTCMDITLGASGGVCNGFGSGGTTWTAFDLGGSKDDVARRVISRPGTGVIVAGWAKDGANRYVFAVSAYYRDSGAPLTRFGSGGKFNHDVYQTGNANLDVNVYAIALSDDTPEDTTIYIAGNYSRVAPHNEYAGLVWALRGWDGTLAPFGTYGYRQIQLGLGNCATNCSEGVGAVAVRHDRSLAISGWAYDMLGNGLMTIGGLTADGALDVRLCAGAGVCQKGYSFPNQGSGNWYAPHSVAEHPMNRNLLAAQASYQPGWNTRYRAGSFYTNRTATTTAWEHWGHDYAYPGVPPALYPSYPAHTIWSGKHQIEVGTYGYDETVKDYRIAIVRFKDDDPIFFDQFGGAHSD